MTAPLRFPNVQQSASDSSFLRSLSYASGFTDELGSRRLASDAAGAVSFEVLQIKPAFAEVPAFERALRARVEEASHLSHVSLAAVHSVERAEGFGLSLVSKYTAGRRVSELAPTEHGPVFALDLIRMVAPALATLHQSGIAHGALSADRIVVARDGRFVVVDHVLGSAIESLDLPRRQLNELGVVVPDGSVPIRFDGRTDMMQLGFLALSLLLRRRLDPADCPGKLTVLLDELVDVVDSPALSAKMRLWLERAMQMGPTPFWSAVEALDAFDDLPSDIDMQRVESARAMLAFPSEVTTTPEPEVTAPREDIAEVDLVVPPSVRETVKVAPQPAKIRVRGFSRLASGIITGLVLLAAGEAAAIFFLTYLRPAGSVIEIRSPSALTVGAPVLPALPPATQTPRPTSPDPASPGAAAAPTKTDAAPPPPASQPPGAAGARVGGLTVSSAVDLQVFKDGKLLGSTAGPIAVNEGAHNLEFVNDTLAFRFRQIVNVKNGLMTSVNIPVPNGRLNINAIPWAEVTIDGVAAGETPIANFSLPIGTHEIVFRHPQLGERKQTVVVKVGPLLRVTQTFQQAFKY